MLLILQQKMTTEIDNVEDEQEEGSVKVSGPIRLVMYLRKLIHQTLVWYITVMDSPQERSIFEIAAIVTDKSDVLDGASDLESASKCESLSKCYDLLFYNCYVKTHDIVINTVYDRRK